MSSLYVYRQGELGDEECVFLIAPDEKQAKVLISKMMTELVNENPDYTNDEEITGAINYMIKECELIMTIPVDKLTKKAILVDIY